MTKTILTYRVCLVGEVQTSLVWVLGFFFFFLVVVVVVVVVENDMSVKLNVFDLPSRAEEDKSYFNL